MSSGRVLASAQIAEIRRDRRRGLLGRDTFDGAFVLRRCRWIHSIGMRFPIDVAFVNDEGVVIKIIELRRHRISTPVRRASFVIEARRGSFERWGLRLGDLIDIRPINEEKRS